MKRSIEFIIFLVFIIGLSIWVYNDISKDTKKAEKPAPAQIAYQAVEPEEEFEKNPLDEIHVPLSDFDRDYAIWNVYISIHEMANTLIRSEDNLYFGIKEINEENLADTRKRIEAYPIDEREKQILLGIINRWEKGDYSQGVFDHNHVWNWLDGKDGKAVALKPEIQKVVDARKKASK